MKNLLRPFENLFNIWPPTRSYKQLIRDAEEMIKDVNEKMADVQQTFNTNYVFSEPITIKGTDGKLYTLNQLLKSHNTLLKQNKKLIARVKELERV